MSERHPTSVDKGWHKRSHLTARGVQIATLLFPLPPYPSFLLAKGGSASPIPVAIVKHASFIWLEAPLCFPYPEFHVVRAAEGDGISVGHPFDSNGLESSFVMNILLLETAVMFVNKSTVSFCRETSATAFFFVENEDFVTEVDAPSRVCDWFLRVCRFIILASS